MFHGPNVESQNSYSGKHQTITIMVVLIKKKKTKNSKLYSKIKDQYFHPTKCMNSLDSVETSVELPQ